MYQIEKKYDEVVWKTPHKKIPELVQTTDDYVVHARGIMVDNEVWFDEYCIATGHLNAWNKDIRNEYGLPRVTPNRDWNEYQLEYFEDIPLYFSYTGSNTFILKYPHRQLLTDDGRWRLYLLLESMDAPDKQTISFLNYPLGASDDNVHAQNILQKLKEEGKERTHRITFGEVKEMMSEP